MVKLLWTKNYNTLNNYIYKNIKVVEWSKNFNNETPRKIKQTHRRFINNVWFCFPLPPIVFFYRSMFVSWTKMFWILISCGRSTWLNDNLMQKKFISPLVIFYLNVKVKSVTKMLTLLIRDKRMYGLVPMSCSEGINDWITQCPAFKVKEFKGFMSPNMRVTVDRDGVWE